MADTEDETFDKAFEGFGEDGGTPSVTPPAEPSKDDPTPPAPVAADPEESKEEEKKNEPAESAEDTTPSEAKDEGIDKKPEEEAKPSEAPAAPVAEEEPKPLTEEALRNIINDVRVEERTSVQAIEVATEEVLEAYYPDGLSNVLRDQNTGKELRTPQDVVDVTNGEMTIDEAAQWLMNEQYKLDQDVAKIKDDARKIAETTVKFKQDGITVLQKYEPLFKAYPTIQEKVWSHYSGLVKDDKDKGVILSAPDMMKFYDDFLEPYRLAYEHGQKQSATAPTAPEPTPEPATPSADDRLDEGGDGGPAPVDDPTDFAQQVTKELAKGV